MTEEDWQKKRDEAEQDRLARVRQAVEDHPPDPPAVTWCRGRLESLTPRELDDERRRLTFRIIGLLREGSRFKVHAGGDWRTVTMQGYTIGYVRGVRGSWDAVLKRPPLALPAGPTNPDAPVILELKPKLGGKFSTQRAAVDYLQWRALKRCAARWKAADELLEGAGEYLAEAEQALGRLSPAQGEKLCRRWLEICRRRRGLM